MDADLHGGQRHHRSAWRDNRGPAAPAARLGGSLQARLVDGTLTEVDPGVGRLFSLVNLHTLGRRLALDFSDLVEQGLHFDEITGSFVFERGDAFTNDLLIETSAASVNLMGRTGLVDRDYDQVITVQPRVSGALPIAGAVLGGPAAAAALVLFNELFSDEVNRLARVQYRIRGPWAAPQVERIGLVSAKPVGGDDAIPDTENR